MKYGVNIIYILCNPPKSGGFLFLGSLKKYFKKFLFIEKNCYIYIVNQLN